MNTDIKYLYTDTTFICNKNGKQLIDYNPQVGASAPGITQLSPKNIKHSTNKISLIIDDLRMTLVIPGEL